MWFPKPPVCRWGTPPIQRGCFVRTLAPPQLDRRTPRPGPTRVCLCELVLAGSGGPASWVRFGAPHHCCGGFGLLLCLAPSGLGLPFDCPFPCLLPCSCHFFLPLVPRRSRPRCLRLPVVSGPGCPGPGRYVFSSARDPALTPPNLFFLFSALLPRCLWRSFVSGPGCSRPCPPPLFFLFLFLFLPLFFSAVFCSPPPSPLGVCFFGSSLLVAWLSLFSCYFGVFCLAFLWLLPCSCRPRLPPPPEVCCGCCPRAARFSVFFHCFLVPACLLDSQQVSPPAHPPPPGVCVVPCPVGCCRAVPAFCVFCVALLPRSVLRVVVWCLDLCCCGLRSVVRCSLGRFFVCFAVLCPAVVCCCVLCRFLGRFVPLRCSPCGLLSRPGLRYRVPRCVPGCCAASCCFASFQAALCCCALGFLVSLCVVPLLTVSRLWALSFALGCCFFGLCVLLCFSAMCVLPCCWFAAVLCAACVLGCRAVHSLSSPLCAELRCAVLVRLRRAVCLVCAVSVAWCRGSLLCVVLAPSGVLWCSVALRCVWCAVLLRAMPCSAVSRGVVLQTSVRVPLCGPALPWCPVRCAVPRGAVLRSGSVLSCPPLKRNTAKTVLQNAGNI